MDGKEFAKVLGKAIFYSSLQSSIGAVEMSSKFSVMNFSKDQETLQRAADALRSYIIIGAVWTIGTVLALYASHGWCGAWLGLATNLVMMGWIIISYVKAFKEAAKNYHLEVPVVFTPTDWIYVTIGAGVLALSMAYIGGYISNPFSD